jgi:hypothetical protein
MNTDGHLTTWGVPWWVAEGQSRVGGHIVRIYIPTQEAFTTIFQRAKIDAIHLFQRQRLCKNTYYQNIFYVIA